MNTRLTDKIAALLFWACDMMVIAILGSLVCYILYHGGKSINWDFLTKPPQVIRAGGGIGPQIFNSFYLLVISMLFTVL